MISPENAPNNLWLGPGAQQVSRGKHRVRPEDDDDDLDKTKLDVSFKTWTPMEFWAQQRRLP